VSRLLPYSAGRTSSADSIGASRVGGREREAAPPGNTPTLVELYDLLTRCAEVKLSAMEAADFVRALREWHLIEMDSDLVSAALSLAEREEMSPWDDAVLEAARRADCTRVLSESLPAGRTYEGVRVENPFV
jgi:predicted nucleic acid-binding protein